VAVDTGSTDGTASLAATHGFRNVRVPWEGFGAARAAAVAALPDCDWLLFLDSDERLGPAAVEAIRRFKASPPQEPCVALVRNNWASLRAGRFLYQREHPVRLVRRDHARFDRFQIVHETVPAGPTTHLRATIEHEYVDSLEALRAKVGRYALLWALRSHREGRRAKAPSLARAIHLGRDLVLRGAAFRGGTCSFRIAAALADYHALKYQLLAEIRAGAYGALVELLRQDRLEEFFRALPPPGELPETSPASWARRAARRRA
jgi:(heptosyl)LPS beta-1,4-glucosyltransferase